MSGGRVLHVVSELGLPTEAFIGDTVAAVASEGWEPYVAALRGERSVDFIRPERVFRAPRPSVAQRGLARLLYRRPHAGAGKLGAFAAVAAPRATAWRVELVHAHFGWAAPYAAALARRLRLPLVVTFYGTDASAPPTPKRWRRERFPPSLCDGPYGEVFALAARLIAVSEFVAERLRGLGYQGPIDLVRPGIPVELFPPSHGPPPLRPLQVLFVGRLVPVKGLDVLLRALVQVAREHPSVRLTVVGDGPQRDELQRLAGTLGLTERVSFEGVRSRKEIVDALLAAHLVVVPSRTMPNGQAEASSIVFKEALAVGVPVVATSSGGLPETCPPQGRHALIAPGEVRPLAGAVSSTLTWVEAAPSQEWQAHAARSREWVTRRYSSSTVGRALAACYGAALSRRPATETALTGPGTH